MGNIILRVFFFKCWKRLTVDEIQLKKGLASWKEVQHATEKDKEMTKKNLKIKNTEPCSVNTMIILEGEDGDN